MWTVSSIGHSVYPRCCLLNKPCQQFRTLGRHPYLLAVRSQNTAAAVAEEPQGDIAKPHSPKPLSKKARDRLRRWKPTPVAELGVASLGRPSEVLVLQDRERPVHSEIAGSSTAATVYDSRILDSVDFESVEKTLHKLLAPLLKASAPRSKADRATLKRQLEEIFTLAQLRSYQRIALGFSPSHTSSPDEATHNELVAEDPDSKEPAKKLPISDATLDTAKSYIISQILNHHLGSVKHVRTQRRKIELVLNSEKQTIEAVENDFGVSVDISPVKSTIRIKGRAQNVSSAWKVIEKLLKAILSRPVSTIADKKAVQKSATPAFLSHISQSFNVTFDWVADGKTESAKQYLKMYYFEAQHLSRPDEAERQILLAERQSSGHDIGILKERFWMFVPSSAARPELIAHQHGRHSHRLGSPIPWHRWAMPQNPTTATANVAQGSKSESILQSLLKWSQSLTTSPHRELSDLSSKLQHKDLTQAQCTTVTSNLEHEIAVLFGRVLFKGDRNLVQRSDPTSQRSDRRGMIKVRTPGKSSLSPVLPGLPGVLSTLTSSPFDTTGIEHHPDCYRLRYVPFQQRADETFKLPVIEIDVERHSRANNVKKVCAILSAHSSKLLLPSLCLDLEVTRRLKYRISTDPGIDSLETSAPWIQLLQHTVRSSEERRPPPFLQLLVPRCCIGESRQAETPVTGGDPTSPEDMAKSLEASLSERSKTEGSSITENPDDGEDTEHKYMLEDWQLIRSNQYKLNKLSLEHLHIEGEGGSRTESLRLAEKSLFDTAPTSSKLPNLIKSAVKLAVRLDEPRLASY